MKRVNKRNYVKGITAFIVVLECVVCSIETRAAEWDKDVNANWNVDGNWVNPATFPNGADAVADFSKKDISDNRTVTLGQNITVGSMTVGDTDHSNVYTFTGNTLTFNGTGGATLTSVSDNGTQNNFLSIVTLGSDLAVQVNGTGRLNVGTKNAFNLGGYTLSNSGTGTGPFRIQSVNTGTDVYFTGTASSRIVQDSATSTLWIGTETGTGTGFAGQTIIKKGRLTYQSQRSDALGTTRPITIGNSAGGSDDAVYQINCVNSWAYYLDNPIVVAANTTGTLTLRVNNTTANLCRIRGGITGDNSLTIEHWGTGEFFFVINPIDFSGTLTHIGDGTGTTTVSVGIGSNVTGVTQNSATSELVLNAANTYTGPTTVSAGTLLINGTQTAATGTVTVGGASATNAPTLRGTGTLGGDVTVKAADGGAAGTLAPGTAAQAGTLTLNDKALTLESGAKLAFRLGTAGDKIAGVSTLTLNGQQWSDFTFTEEAGFVPGKHVLVEAAAVSGSLGTSISGSLGGKIHTLSVDANHDLVVTTFSGTIILVL